MNVTRFGLKPLRETFTYHAKREVAAIAELAKVQVASNEAPTGQAPKSGDSGYAKPVNFFSGISSSGDSIDATGKEQ